MLNQPLLEFSKMVALHPQHCQKATGWMLHVWLVCLILFSYGSCANRSVSICVLAPNLPRDCELFSLPKVEPAVALGIEKIRQLKILPGVDLQVVYKNSRCSDIDATIAAFEMKDQNVHLFLGPINDMAVNSVAQYASRWNIPLITPGAMSAFYFENKYDKRTLTRIGLGFDEVVRVVLDILRYYNWNKVKVIYEGRTFSPSVFPEYYDSAGESFRTVMMGQMFENDIILYASMFQTLEDLLARRVGYAFSGRTKQTKCRRTKILFCTFEVRISFLALITSWSQNICLKNGVEKIKIYVLRYVGFFPPTRLIIKSKL